jgi:hypothetical protein
VFLKNVSQNTVRFPWLLLAGLQTLTGFVDHHIFQNTVRQTGFAIDLQKIQGKAISKKKCRCNVRVVVQKFLHNQRE